MGSVANGWCLCVCMCVYVFVLVYGCYHEPSACVGECSCWRCWCKGENVLGAVYLNDLASVCLCVCAMVIKIMLSALRGLQPYLSVGVGYNIVCEAFSVRFCAGVLVGRQ